MAATKAYFDPRRYTIPLIVFFVVVALLEIAAYAINQGIVTRQQEVAAFRAHASEQRSLSLTIALLSQQYATATDEDIRAGMRNRIATLAGRMRAGHTALLAGDPAAGFDQPESATVDHILFDGPLYLDQTVRRFLYAVDEVASRPWSDDLIDNHFMTEVQFAASGPLSAGLDRLVEAVEIEGREAVAWLETGLLATSGVVVILIAAIAALVVVPMLRKISSQTRDLIDQAQTDILTGCRNRRSFMRDGEAEFARFKRYSGKLSVIMFDIDHFKSVNDTYGHACGDEVLRSLAGLCHQRIRKSDVLGRLGGEEFAILMPETSFSDADIAAEKLRQAIEAIGVDCDGRSIGFTVSFGVTTATLADDDLGDVINRADRALYEAKNQGRNRVASILGEASGSSTPNEQQKSGGTVSPIR